MHSAVQQSYRLPGHCRKQLRQFFITQSSRHQRKDGQKSNSYTNALVRCVDRARKKQTGPLGLGWWHYRFAKEERLPSWWTRVHGPRYRGWDASACGGSSGSWNTGRWKGKELRQEPRTWNLWDIHRAKEYAGPQEEYAISKIQTKGIPCVEWVACSWFLGKL